MDALGRASSWASNVSASLIPTTTTSLLLVLLPPLSVSASNAVLRPSSPYSLPNTTSHHIAGRCGSGHCPRNPRRPA
ncbi:hypothetical protein OH77DRAFT_1422882 [Trametes cingulata]|nr:hypothetical protein OH77DRAFT_1422882 [Trametes cingulata]